MKDFLKHLILLMACLTAVVAVLVLLKVKYVLPIDFALVVYFSAIAYISQHIICRTLAKNPKKFPQSFMLVEFGKLFLHIVVLAASIYFYSSRHDGLSAKSFLVCFAVLFLVYLVFGTWEMYRIAKHK